MPFRIKTLLKIRIWHHLTRIYALYPVVFGLYMYTREQLSVYPYFEKNLNGRRISDILDPLTGLVSRQFMIGFVKDLIAQGIPFSFGILDLDNFKYVNDTYGHSIGDGVLKSVADRLAAYLGDYGIAGRFGGDEYLFVNFRDLDYSSKKKFCFDLYGNSNSASTTSVLRRSIKIDEYELFATGTAGMASYPEDAADYDSLFATIDKALYRGKTKGRNCYIIYVPEKHANIEIRKMKKNSLYKIFKNMSIAFDSSPTVIGKMTAIYQALAPDLNLTDMYFIAPDGIMRSVAKGTEIGPAQDVRMVVEDDLFATNTVENLNAICPVFCGTLTENKLETVLIAEVRVGPKSFGYILFAEPRSLRIWQDSEMSIMFSFARMLAGFMIGRQVEMI